MGVPGIDLEQAIESYPERSQPAGNGIVSYREAGSGPPLILLHGIGSGSGSWIHQLSELSHDFRVVAWDAPGYGESTPLLQDAPLASDYANALAQLVNGLGIDSFVLIGHSLGAIMAAAFAAENPRRVKQLVLLSPARGYGQADAAERERRLHQRLTMLAELGPEGMAEQRSSAMVSTNASPEALAWVAWNTRRLRADGYRQAARMLAYDDIIRYAQVYAEEVWVYSGEEDRITTVDNCRAIANAFVNGRYQSIAALGHAVYVEAPAVINRILVQAGGANES